MFSAADHAFMFEALRLAEQGLYTATPNPRVGALLVKDGVIIGRGSHLQAGGPHAEVFALGQAGEQARGATAYVTLEPCSHFGKTPPCADALIAAGVVRVVAAMQDPNSQVCGRGFAKLRSAGIETESGLLAAQALELNRGFVSRMTRARPWVRVKSAASLDGRTALASGVSQWITGSAARRDAHAFRARSCAIMTGIGTVLFDDPRMSVRDVDTTRQPLKIVVDSSLQIPLGAKILAGGNAIVACARAEPAKKEQFEDIGVEVVELPDGKGQVDLPALLNFLGKRGINELLVEAGEKLNGAVIAQGLADEIVCYFAPHLIGSTGRGMFHLAEISDMDNRIGLDVVDVRMIGRDIRVISTMGRKNV